MNSQQLKDLLDYIMKNNSWEAMSYYHKGRKQPKYLDIKLQFILDTRDGIAFYLKFRTGKEEKSFDVENEKDLKKVYKWLDEVKDE